MKRLVGGGVSLEVEGARQVLVVTPVAGNPQRTLLEKGAAVNVKAGDSVDVGQNLADEAHSYRLVERTDSAGNVERRQEIEPLATGDKWRQRGAESTERGTQAEATARAQTRSELDATGTPYVEVDGKIGAGGFDGVFVEFSGEGDAMVAKIRVMEVKAYPSGNHVPYADFTAITDNLKTNADALFKRLKERAEDLPTEQSEALLGAVGRKDLEIELWRGPTTRIGGLESTARNTTLQRLEASIAATSEAEKAQYHLAPSVRDIDGGR